LPPAPADQPQRIATQVRTRNWGLIIGLCAPLLAPCLIIGGIYVHQQVLGNFMWMGDHPVVADLDGDGTDDAIGYARYVQSSDQMKLYAVSGKDGHKLWETAALGTYIDVYQSVIAVSGTTILRGDTDKRPLLEAYDAKTGAKRWTTTPSEVIDKLCASSTPGTAIVVTKDKAKFTVDLATGKLAPTAADSCTPLVSNLDLRPFFSSEEPHHDAKVPGMSTSHVLGATAPFILDGAKDPGTRVPMLAAIDDSEHVLWKTEVPGRDPMTAKHGNAEYVAVGDQIVAVVYEHDNDHEAPTVTAFDRATGARKWEVATKYTGHMFISMHGVAIGKNAIFVVVENSIQIFDPQTGARRFVLGRTD
jgi:hypothetical protein